ncbi:hypothetical protein TNIN_121171 [Trichonephila inaurata madagascariensis]|uniref:Uncharacterized protein n=1 Tax=Trichonephila inaurata madagascariensis TaxID=2747483 RepID=A0A8X6XNX4_9ARAC|nr:hypothetical protein TNIN_121171 [Trichonephila inaurata madagascariensis]
MEKGKKRTHEYDNSGQIPPFLVPGRRRVPGNAVVIPVPRQNFSLEQFHGLATGHRVEKRNCVFLSVVDSRPSVRRVRTKNNAAVLTEFPLYRDFPCPREKKITSFP